jgi:hypothetical protein
MTIFICTLILIAGIWDVASTFSKTPKLAIRNRNIFLVAAILLFIFDSETLHLLYRGY